MLASRLDRIQHHRKSTIFVLVLCLILFEAQGWTAGPSGAKRRIPSSPPARPRHVVPQLCRVINESYRSSRRQQRRRSSRRAALLTFACCVTVSTTAAHAGEIGTKVNAAVTESDLGVSVRRSVVRGAQYMDRFDEQWEQISDKFRLGAARQRQEDKPAPKIIPDPLPLDRSVAQVVLNSADQVFGHIARVSAADLERQVRQVSVNVQPSFARAGLSAADMQVALPQNGAQLNYQMYCHFKAYIDLAIERKLPFYQLKKDFEAQWGQQLVSKLVRRTDRPNTKASSPDELQQRLDASMLQIRQLTNALVQAGLVAQIDVTVAEPEVRDDWADDLTDLAFSVALDGDQTLPAQILLLEAGYRLYPCFGRCAIQYVLQSQFGGTTQTVDVTDYFMDTDYNADPDQFTVKEILLNVVLDNSAH